MSDTTRIWIGPTGHGRWLVPAVEAGGGEVTEELADAHAVVWVSESDAEGLRRDVLAQRPDIPWVQLPWAGVDPFLHLLDEDRTWTCAKGIYGPAVAEHVLACILAGLKRLHAYARARSWEQLDPQRLHGANVTVVGGGGITDALLPLLAPFGCTVTVVRRTDEPVEGAHRTVTSERLHEALADADVVVLTLALTDDTRGIIGADELAVMRDDAWLVNVARGAHVVTEALVEALRDGAIGGAVLDVTDPEPLPDGHALWTLPNVLITPHTANTKAMAAPELAARVTRNVANFRAGRPLEGVVDPRLGY